MYIAEHLTRTKQAERTARQPRSDAVQQLGCAFWQGIEVMLHRRHPPLALPLRSSLARGTGAMACNYNVKSCSGTGMAALLATTSMVHLLCLLPEDLALILLTEPHASQFDHSVSTLQGYDCISTPRPRAQQARWGPPRGMHCSLCC